MPRRVLRWLPVLLAGFIVSVHADSLESVLMPGKVIEGHAKVETDCQECHVRFKKGAQSGMCLECHEDIAHDAMQRRGYHGHLTEQECRACHTEHKGRNANIAPLDEKRFDHKLTDFPLKGGHVAAKVQCRDCHKPGKKHRDAPADCVACHQKDDTHKGSLGKSCGNCHSEQDWKTVRFDHSSTRFPLTGKHRDVGCKDCHADPKFKGAPMQCVACHKKDDDRKGHKGRFGRKCETCHVDRDWKVIIFNHDRDTKYALRGKHQLAKCSGCHTGILYQQKVATQCVACHRDDDQKNGHKGKFGEKCESCHIEKDWGISIFNHDRHTKYPLRGQHARAKCSVCHTGTLYREKLSTVCSSCHEKDDKHKGQQGRDCQRCHNETRWNDTLFDHGLSRFPLLGKHAKIECKKCHLTAQFKDTKSTCVACHDKDDQHKRRLGTECQTCHNAISWKAWRFDHDRQTHFRLDGAHKGLDCLACHTKPLTGRASLSGSCASCHDDDDVHDGGFGRDCQRCHLTSSFRKLRPGVAGFGQ